MKLPVNIYSTSPKGLVPLAVTLLLGSGVGLNAQNAYFYKGGTIVHNMKAEEVGRLKLSDDKSQLSLRDVLDAEVKTLGLSEVDSIVIGSSPRADVLDVEFLADGTARDISGNDRSVVAYNTAGALTTYFSPNLNRYVANFNNTLGGSANGFYKVDYSTDTAFQNAMADGHSVEVVITPDFTSWPNKEIKFFSTHEQGGTGFLVTTQGMANGKNVYCFLPNVTTTGSSNWRWAKTAEEPESGKAVHLVGVWDKEQGMAYIYLNGELAGTVTAPGELKFPTSACYWWAIGGDPSGLTSCGPAWTGDIAVVRIFDDALTADDAKRLWLDVADGVKKDNQANTTEFITDVNYLTGLSVRPVDGNFTLYGSEFEQGDKVELQAAVAGGESYTVTLDIEGEKATATLPDGFAGGTYTLNYLRGDATQRLGNITLNVSDKINVGSQIIAHRGRHEVSGASENSLASLREALKLGVYGSETDVWITADDAEIVVNHDATLSGVTLQTSTYDEVKNLTLSNGEKLPTLTSFLELLKEYPDSPTKLIIEIKSHSTSSRSIEASAKVVELVEQAGLADRVGYIAFDYNVCKWFANKGLLCQYLSGNAVPRLCFEDGVKGIDYSESAYETNPTWLADANALGMVTNVWTVNSVASIAKWMEQGVGYVTTDIPLSGLRIKEHYDKNKY